MNSGATGSGIPKFTFAETSTVTPGWTPTSGEVYEVQNANGTAPDFDITAA